MRKDIFAKPRTDQNRCNLNDRTGDGFAVIPLHRFELDRLSDTAVLIRLLRQQTASVIAQIRTRTGLLMPTGIDDTAASSPIQATTAYRRAANPSPGPGKGAPGALWIVEDSQVSV